jgi:hypothetical protein
MSGAPVDVPKATLREVMEKQCQRRTSCAIETNH